MKLGLVIYGSLETLSGGYLYDRKLVEYLRRQGDTVDIISLPWRNYAAHLTDNLHFRLPPDLDLLLQDELNHPSLVSANHRPHAYPIVSLVHHLRCSEQRPAWQNWFYRLAEKLYLNSVDGFIYNSRATKGAVNSLVESRKPGLIAYPPSDRFGSGLTESQVAARAHKPGPLTVLFVGNVIHRKGLHILLEATSLVKPDIRVQVIGSLRSDPSFAREMRKKAEALSLQSCVFFHGSIEDEKLVTMLKSAHVLVVPSSYEGFGIVYLEGMAFGLPAIGTTAGGASEIISDGKNGYLVPPDDVAALARRLSGLVRNRDWLAKMSVEALTRYHKEPAWEETAGQIRDFLFSMLHPIQQQ